MVEKWKNFTELMATKLTKWWTNSNYYHCELIVANKWISANTTSGIHIYELEPLYDTNYDYFKLEPYKLSNINKEKKEFWKFVYSLEGQKYDWKGIFLSQVAEFGVHAEDKWFCSEIVTKLLQLLNINEVLNVEPHKVSPEDLYKLLGGCMVKINLK